MLNTIKLQYKSHPVSEALILHLGQLDLSKINDYNKFASYMLDCFEQYCYQETAIDILLKHLEKNVQAKKSLLSNYRDNEYYNDLFASYMSIIDLIESKIISHSKFNKSIEEQMDKIHNEAKN